MIDLISDGLYAVHSSRVQPIFVANLPRSSVLGILNILLRLVVVLEAVVLDASELVVVTLLLTLDVHLLDTLTMVFQHGCRLELGVGTMNGMLGISASHL